MHPPRAVGHVRQSDVGQILTALSNVDYSLERKAEIKMAKRHVPAYTF
jgi:hypothetical protein